MRMYHTHFGIPLGSIPGWWDERKRNETKSLCYLPTYDKIFLINYYAVFHAYAFPVTTFAWKPNGIMKIGAHTSLEFATNVIGTLYKVKSTLSWIAHLRTYKTAHSVPAPIELCTPK
eukprot:794605-Pelagomonas_calceolata.AAC.1